MNDSKPIQRSRLAQRVYDLWGPDRVVANSTLIESASQALARIAAIQPDATVQLDAPKEPDDE